MTSSEAARELALRIIRCDELNKAKINPEHACNRIVRFQTYGPFQDRWQVPEPWRGDIEHAPLLFVSSNPSIDPLDDAPWNDQTDLDILRYFSNGIAPNFPYATSASGERLRRPVSFWLSMRKRAEELFARTDLEPGKDFALTEVVHCKSRGEEGVSKALDVCAQLFLANILSLSRARVIVFFGSRARTAVNRLSTRAPIAGSERLVIELPHPNARGPRTLDVLPPGQVEHARRLLNECSRAV